MSKSARILASSVAAVALAVPAAQARPAVDPPSHNGYIETKAPAPMPTSDGFDAGSAAIGAGGSVALIALLSAGALATRRVRVGVSR